MSFPRILFAVSMGIMFAALVGATVCASETPAMPAEKTWEELAAMCKSAQADFRPLTAANLDPIVTQLKAATERLDAWLKEAGPHAANWRKYLLWEKFQQQLQGPGLPDRQVLWEIYQRYASGHEGLTLVWFADVQHALCSYIEVSGAIDKPEVKTKYEGQLAQLAKHLETFAARPTAEDALVISESVGWLKSARQAPELVAAIERRFDRPNLLAEASADVVNAGMEEPVDDTAPIRDCIMRTAIYGTGHTVGKTQAVLAEGDGYGVMDNLVRATVHTSTVGYNGPVCIYATGETKFNAIKRLWVNEHGVFAHPAKSSAVTRTCIYDIQSRRGSRLVERIAWRKAAKQVGTAEWIAARHAECRVNRRVDAQAAENLEEANDNFQRKIRRPLIEHKLFPELFHVSSDPGAIWVRCRRRGVALLAAAVPPPEAEKADMVLRIHESMINNFALDALGGMTVHEEKLQAAVIDMFGKLPEKMKGDEDEEPWAITFARRQPVSVVFADDGFVVTIRGVEYYKGNTPHPAMNVTATYKIEKSPEGVFQAVRQGDLKVFPPDFDPTSGQQLSARYTIIRNLLDKRFGKVFDPVITGKGFTFSGRWKKAGKFLPVQFTCRDGWLVLAWNRATPPNK